MKKYESETVFPVKRKEERTTAAHFDNVWTIFLLPVGAGFIVFLATLFISVGNPRMSGGTAFVMGGLTMIGVLAWLLSVSKRILWSTEEITEYDWDRDGHIGEPPQDTKTYIELPLSPTQQLIVELDAPWELVSEWCITAVNGGSLAYAPWESRFALPDGKEGRERYAKYRQQLVKRGLALEKSNAGLKLTRTGWLFVEAMAEVPEPTPLLEAGEAENHSPHRLTHAHTEE
jgi:hypothetical protein